MRIHRSDISDELSIDISDGITELNIITILIILIILSSNTTRATKRNEKLQIKILKFFIK